MMNYQQAHTIPIPKPAGLGVLGNIFDINAKAPVQSLMKLASEYGPIFRLELPGRNMVAVSSAELVAELSDESRFDKLIWAPLRNVRRFAGDGLFTAWTFEPNWRKAHHILLPNFSTLAMQGYMPQMIDIAEQLLLKWERLNPDESVDVPEDMTRLTLDTIGLCGFNYRFNSFYREESHPFVQAMTRALGEALGQLSRLPVQDALMFRAHRQYEEDIAFMNQMVDKLIQERKNNPEALATQKDLLNYMLTGVDKQSGEGLDDANIRYQIITFLIAGHETTSGLLSFAVYYLLKHPDVLAQAYEEVDRVLGGDLDQKPTYQQVHKLIFIGQILKESLRLWPTAPAFALYPLQPTSLGGKYEILKDDELAVLIPVLHRDPAVWGEDAEAFKPERFAPGRESSIPPHAYKPFGNGQRACIGRQFAMQEAALVLGMILQRFELIDHTNYQLVVKETLTLKPDNFTIRLRVRTNRPTTSAQRGEEEQKAVPAEAPIAVPAHHTPVLVLYGSNLGTAEGVARQIAEDGRAYGFEVNTAPLDDYVDQLPEQGAVVIVSSSYNGGPPDNAVGFYRWLQSNQLAPEALKGVRYCVFGCGDHNWATTYQSVPTLIDTQLAAHGAKRVYHRGAGDAADDFDGQFRNWYGTLWQSLAKELGISEQLASPDQADGLLTLESVQQQASVPYVAAYGARPMTVVANRELHCKDGSCPSPRSTRHLEIALPEDLTYRAGDHMGILPRNSMELVQRVLARFRVNGEEQIVIHRRNGGKSHLPIGTPVIIFDLLTRYVELQETATRTQIKVLADHTECPPEKQKLLALSGDSDESVIRYRAEVLDHHRSLLDLLEECMACELPFARFLELLPPLRPRYYSISSSPLVSKQQASLTVAVVDAVARSGRGYYKGVASNYLVKMPEGGTVYAFLRSPNVPFFPPDNPATPMIMVGPGTGLAPFRGFLQERSAMQKEGKPVGGSLLFFGCRHPQQDFIYEAELREYESQGITTLISAFSRVEGQPKKYVQDIILERADEVFQLISAGAVVYVCGDASNMAPEVQAAFKAVYQQCTGQGAEEAALWFQQLEAENRYLTDVWAAG